MFRKGSGRRALPSQNAKTAIRKITRKSLSLLSHFSTPQNSSYFPGTASGALCEKSPRIRAPPSSTPANRESDRGKNSRNFLIGVYHSNARPISHSNCRARSRTDCQWLQCVGNHWGAMQCLKACFNSGIQ